MKKAKVYDRAGDGSRVSLPLLKIQTTSTEERSEILRGVKAAHPQYCGGCWCCSERSRSRCQRRERFHMLARIHEALGRPEYVPNGWIFMVLTIDRGPAYANHKKGSRHRHRGLRLGETYDALSRMTQRLRRRLNRCCERNMWRPPKSDWLATIDVDRTGWPRIKLVFYCPELAVAIEEERRRVCADEVHKIRTMRRAGVSRADAQHAVQAANLKSQALFGDLSECASTGRWGANSTAEQVRDARVLTRCAASLVGDAMNPAARRLSDAGVHFRRVRAGACFLPERATSSHIETKRDDR